MLGQRKVHEKSNEITAIPKLPDALELSGTVVTIDAMGCQRSIAGKIVEKKADYILAGQGEPGQVCSTASWTRFKCRPRIKWPKRSTAAMERVESRRCSLLADLSPVDKAAEWPSSGACWKTRRSTERGAAGCIRRKSARNL